jgi:hypothetical protein
MNYELENIMRSNGGTTAVIARNEAIAGTGMQRCMGDCFVPRSDGYRRSGILSASAENVPDGRAYFPRRRKTRQEVWHTFRVGGICPRRFGKISAAAKSVPNHFLNSEQTFKT